MAHTIVSLYQESFDVRVLAFGGCAINIDGETRECNVVKSDDQIISPTYTVTDKGNGKTLCTFRPYHLFGGPRIYEIEGASQSGGSAALIVPEHGLLHQEDETD